MRLTRDDIVKKQDYLNIIFDDKHIIKSKIWIWCYSKYL
jgi:hypothetical protein